MEKIKIAVLHQDIIYAHIFAIALAQRWKASSVFVVDANSAEELKDADFILCDQAQSAFDFGKKGIHLYEDKEDLMEGTAAIARFQPISTIVLELKNICSSGASKNLVIPRIAGKVPFIGITSGSGGIGTSTAAVVLGRILSRLYSKKTLYIAFEKSNPADYAFCFEPSAIDLNYLLYRISTKEQAFLKRISEYVGKDSYGLAAIWAQSDINPLAFSAEEDIFDFLMVVAQYADYDRVILDVPFSFAYWENVMRLCEKQIIHYGFREHCHAASDRAKRELEDLCESDHLEPAHHILELHTLWDEDSFIIKEDGFDVDIHGQLGAEVRELADRLESG